MKYKTATYLSASILSTLFAVGTAGACQLFNHSWLPPMGGGWKLAVATPIVSWIVIFLIVLVDRRVNEPRKFSLDRPDSEKDSRKD
jgi:hypothetical protein